MKRLSTSLKIYLGLLCTLAALAAVNVFLPQGDFVPARELPVSRIVLALVNVLAVLVVYGTLGWIGLRLSAKLGFAEIRDPGNSNAERFLTPAVIGLCVGALMVAGDLLFGRFHSVGPLPHPPFPASLTASVAAAIGEELLFRLFFISFWVWLVSSVLLKNRRRNEVFIGVSIVSALVFAAAHLPAVMFLYDMDTPADLPVALVAEIFVLNSLVSLPAAFYLRKAGFLAAVGIHFWADLVWHVLWGLART